MRDEGGGIDFHHKHIGILVCDQSRKTVRFSVDETERVCLRSEQTVSAFGGLLRKQAEQAWSDDLF